MENQVAGAKKMSVKIDVVNRHGVVFGVRERDVSVGKKFIIHRQPDGKQIRYDRTTGHEVGGYYGNFREHIQVDDLSKLVEANPIREVLERVERDFEVVVVVKAKTLAGAKSMVRRLTDLEVK